jgi:group II intron reverse transcriptase/maturase
VHIPKGDGSKTRPIGIPTFEDKVLQRAVAMILGAIYEQDFLDCSYGFRPGRSVHQALEALWQEFRSCGGGWVLEVDIKGFFDTLVHQHLREFLSQRVRDGVIRRTVNKWLKAGVLEDGFLSRSDLGTPQGGVVSPLLANVYLHHVLDQWFEEQIKPRLAGRAFLIRYADDFVIVFEHEADARRVHEVLSKRFGKYGLELHPEKTKIVRFKRPRHESKGRGADDDGQPPETFDLLGFTHYWGRSRRGYWTPKRKTARDRFKEALRRIAEWCRENRHLKVRDQHAKLGSKVQGHYQFYGITGNWQALSNFLTEVERTWKTWLGRRSQRAFLSWERFKQMLEVYPLPTPRITKSYVT